MRQAAQGPQACAWIADTNAGGFASEVFSPGIWWIGFKMNRSGSEVQILQMYS
jgi:hypothetical protein